MTYKNKAAVLAASLLSLCVVQPVLASDFYLKAGGNYMRVDTEDARMSPIAVELSGGWYFDKQLALEVQVAQGVKEGDEVNVDVELDFQAGLSLRFESPEVDGGKLYLLGGYAVTELDVDRSETGEPGTLEYKGGNFGLGIQLRPVKNSDCSFYLQAQRYFAKDHVSIDQVQLGVMYEF